MGGRWAQELDQDSGDRAHRGRQDKHGTVNSPEPPLPLVFSRVFHSREAQVHEGHV